MLCPLVLRSRDAQRRCCTYAPTVALLTPNASAMSWAVMFHSAALAICQMRKAIASDFTFMSVPRIFRVDVYYNVVLQITHGQPERAKMATRKSSEKKVKRGGSQVVAFRLPAGLLAKLDRQAKKESITRNRLVAWILATQMGETPEPDPAAVDLFG